LHLLLKFILKAHKLFKQQWTLVFIIKEPVIEHVLQLLWKDAFKSVIIVWNLHNI
jgi:hypothetical protein